MDLECSPFPANIDEGNDGVLSDLRQAFRSVLRHSTFVALVCAILALGIGAATMAFGIHAVAFINTWIPHPERLGWVFSIDTRHANDRAGVSLPDFLDFRERTHAFASLGARTSATMTLTGRGQASRLGAVQVTSNFMEMWGLRIVDGRGFQDGEDLPEAPRVVIVSNRLWKTKLGGETSVVGTTLTLDGAAHTVVGVLDPRFDLIFTVADLWVPLDLAAARKAPRDARRLLVIGVLRPGVTVAQAHGEVQALARQLASEHPDTNRGWDARVVDTHTGRTSPLTYYNLGLTSLAGTLVLLNACVNVALLLLSRGIARQKEFSVRLAIGASWFRIARQQTLEGLLIAIPSGVVGLGLMVAGLRLLQTSADTYYQRINVDWHLFAFVMSVALLVPLIFGLVPAVQLLRNRTSLTTGGWSEAQSGLKGRRIQRILAASQLGAALILLIVSAIVLRSLVASILRDVGFDSRKVLTAELTLPVWKYPDRQALPDSFLAFVDRVSRMPQVSAAAASTVIPAITSGPLVPATLESEPLTSNGAESAQLAVTTPHAFDAVGIDVLSGRDFTAHDTADTPPVAIVNRQFALRYGPSPQDLIGRRLRIRGEARLREIVGIVGNATNFEGGDVPPFVYLPHTQEPQRTMFLLARVPAGTSPEPLRHAIADVDPDVAPYQLRTVRDAIRRSESGSIALFGTFGVMALSSGLLAALGLFGVFSCFVADRRRDFALRLALGASTRDLNRVILKEAFLTVAPGVAAGLIGGALAAGFATHVIYDAPADAGDPIVYGGSVLLVAISAAAALMRPALRARSVQVSDVLRTS